LLFFPSPEPKPEEKPKQVADLVTTCLGLLGALQVLENWLKDGFAILLEVVNVRHQEGNARESSVVVAIGFEVLSWIHEGD
jgi:hypothetical protein